MCNAATSEDQQRLLDVLKVIEPNFDYFKHSTVAQLKKFPTISRRPQQHTSGAYVWQHFSNPACLTIPDLPLSNGPSSSAAAAANVPDDADATVLLVPALVPSSVLAGSDAADSEKKYAPMNRCIALPQTIRMPLLSMHVSWLARMLQVSSLATSEA